MKIQLLVLCTLFTIISICGQKRKIRPLIWTTHEKNTDIIGVSLGFYPTDINSVNHVTKTFGLRLEPVIFSPLYLFLFNPTLKRKPTQSIYGINISTGTLERINTYGISITGLFNNIENNIGITIAGFSNSVKTMNGIAIAFGWNSILKGNGISISGVGAGSEKFNGIQISGFNDTIEFNGIQIGTWNNIDHTNKTFRGLQIGLQNSAGDLRGVQIGLWNKNNKRSLPFINWNFRK